MPEPVAEPALNGLRLNLRIVSIVMFNFASYLTIGLPLAVLPGYVHDVMGFSAFWAGLVISLQYFATLLSRPHAGRYADLLGPKKIVVFGLCGCFLSGLGYLTAGSTGLNDNVKEINDALDKLNAEKGWEICIHVDAATGGFIHPFIDPDTVWDFRLKWVLSISVSGHKFGLVYPGVGWVVWKDKQYLPEEMNFAVNYLGANIPSISINFSRPGNQVLAQYYQFLRLGMEGYRQIQQNCIDVCLYLKQQLKEMGIFEFFSDDMPNPLFIWKLKNDSSRKWTLYDLSDALHAQGWQVPAYTMPKNMEDVVIMRVVVRQGTGKDLADLLVKDIKTNIAQLNQLQEPTNSAILWNKREPQKPRGFNHSR